MANEPAGKPPARRRSRRRTPPAQECVPPVKHQKRRRPVQGRIESDEGEKEERVLETQTEKKLGQTCRDNTPSPPRPTILRGRTAGPPKIRRDPSEASPRPKSPRAHWKDLGEEHRPLADACPRPVKYQKGTAGPLKISDKNTTCPRMYGRLNAKKEGDRPKGKEDGKGIRNSPRTKCVQSGTKKLPKPGERSPTTDPGSSGASGG